MRLNVGRSHSVAFIIEKEVKVTDKLTDAHPDLTEAPGTALSPPTPPPTTRSSI